jgi:rhodanese-related sulfurtransferase
MFFKKKYESISMVEAKKLKNAAIIDVRTKAEFDTGSMPGAKNIEMNGIVLNTEMFLDKDKTYYILCQSGGRSSMVCDNLSKKGYNVINIAGGMNAY